jgi:thiamine pyrophosphokinase
MSEINKQKEGLPQKIALIICNGNPPPEKLLHQLWQEADYRVAADGGANQLYCYNLIPDAVVGDFDSIKPEVRKKLPNSKLFHVKEQDTNDADKAVRHCLKRECTEIHILGAEGSRNDQFLSSLEILFKYTPNVRLILWTPLERMEFILDNWKANLPPGTILSLLPSFGGAQGVVTHGLEFSLDGHDLLPGKTPSGVSNLVISNPVSVTLKKGQLLLVVQHTTNYS